jgi:hypothetical protein
MLLLLLLLLCARLQAGKGQEQQQPRSCQTLRRCWVLSGVLLWLQLQHAWKT